jgi:hypothetical protein
MNQCETPLAGNDGVLAVHEEDFFVGNHFGILGENGRGNFDSINENANYKSEIIAQRKRGSAQPQDL